MFLASDNEFAMLFLLNTCYTSGFCLMNFEKLIALILCRDEFSRVVSRKFGISICDLVGVRSVNLLKCTSGKNFSLFMFGSSLS